MALPPVLAARLLRRICTGESVLGNRRAVKRLAWTARGVRIWVVPAGPLTGRAGGVPRQTWAGSPTGACPPAEAWPARRAGPARGAVRRTTTGGRRAG